MTATFMLFSMIALVTAESNIAVSGPPGGRSSIKGVSQTNTFTAENALVWKVSTNNDGKMQNFPGHYQELDGSGKVKGSFQLTTADTISLSKDSVISYHCPSSPGPCDIAVFLYECHPCATAKGGLPTYLAGEGFKRTRCGPTFTTQDGGFQHRMTTFITTIAASETREIVLPGDVEYVAFALSNGGGFTCESKADVNMCHNSNLKGHCTWNVVEGECQLSKCVQRGPVPSACDLNTCPFSPQYSQLPQQP